MGLLPCTTTRTSESGLTAEPRASDAAEEDEEDKLLDQSIGQYWQEEVAAPRQNLKKSGASENPILADAGNFGYDILDSDLFPDRIQAGSNWDLNADLPDTDAGARQANEYLLKSLKQVLLGNYTDDLTALGTAGQMALGLTGADILTDARDLSYDLRNWAWTPEHLGQTALDAVGLIPVIGAVKNLDELAALFKALDGADALAPAARGAADYAPGAAAAAKKILSRADRAAGLTDRSRKAARAADAGQDELDNAIEAIWNEGDEAENLAADRIKTTKGAGDADKIPWDSWDNYEKVIENNQVYAKVGDRLYSRHAVNRMQPSGNRFGPNIYLGLYGEDYGRSVAPQVVEDVIHSVKPFVQNNGNLVYISGTVKVVTNQQGGVSTVVTYLK